MTETLFFDKFNNLDCMGWIGIKSSEQLNWKNGAVVAFCSQSSKNNATKTSNSKLLAQFQAELHFNVNTSNVDLIMVIIS